MSTMRSEDGRRTVPHLRGDDPRRRRAGRARRAEPSDVDTPTLAADPRDARCAELSAAAAPERNVGASALVTATTVVDPGSAVRIGRPNRGRARLSAAITRLAPDRRRGWCSRRGHRRLFHRAGAPRQR
jgi:hypothetical protein